MNNSKKKADFNASDFILKKKRRDEDDEEEEAAPKRKKARLEPESSDSGSD